MALYDREDRQFLCVPKPSKVKIGILLEDNRTQADHSSNSDVNFSVNNQATTVRISLSLSEFSFLYEVHLYTPKKPPKPIQLATAMEDTDKGGKTQKRHSQRYSNDIDTKQCQESNNKKLVF